MRGWEQLILPPAAPLVVSKATLLLLVAVASSARAACERCGERWLARL